MGGSAGSRERVEDEVAQDPRGLVSRCLPEGPVHPHAGWRIAPAPPAGWQQPARLDDGWILLVGGVVNGVTPDGGMQVPWAELYKWP